MTRRVTKGRPGARIEYNRPPAAVAKPARAAGSVDEYAQHWFPGARPVAEGTFGAVFALASRPRALPPLAARVEGAPMPARAIAVKLVRFDPRYPSYTWKEFLQENLHEAEAHAYLANKDTCTRGGCPGARLCSTAFTPKFYGAGVDPHAGVFVTFMEMLRGQTLHAWDDGQAVPARLYVNIEKALATSWMLGVVHGDMHPGNIMLVRGGVKIFDFGRAVLLPPSVRARISKALSNVAKAPARSLAEAAWYARDMAQSYVNHAQHRRNVPWYHSDGKLLLALYERVDRKGAVPQLRSEAWGCKKRTRQAAGLNAVNGAAPRQRKQRQH